jgi:8-oxo-dGTP diphosphatase
MTEFSLKKRSMDPYSELQAAARVQGLASTVVGLIVVRQQRILLLKRRPDDFMPDIWEIPGGHVDPGETLAQACARELHEETSLALTEIVSHAGGYDYDGEFGRTRQWNFWVKARGDAVVHPEHAAYRWVLPRDWHTLPMSPEMRASLDAFAAGPLYAAAAAQEELP